jgi:hypothetical protein
MTRQCLIGEPSVRLEQLQAAAGYELARDVARLRYRVDAGPVAGHHPDAHRLCQGEQPALAGLILDRLGRELPDCCLAKGLAQTAAGAADGPCIRYQRMRAVPCPG